MYQAKVLERLEPDYLIIFEVQGEGVRINAYDLLDGTKYVGGIPNTLRAKALSDAICSDFLSGFVAISESNVSYQLVGYHTFRTTAR